MPSLIPSIAQLGPSDEWMPFLLGFIFIMIPIIAILTSHQQKMAKIMRQGHSSPQASEEIAALRAEMARLTQAVHQQTIALDSLTRNAQVGARSAAEEPPQFLQGR